MGHRGGTASVWAEREIAIGALVDDADGAVLPRDGSVVAAEARVDNRPELSAELGAAPAAGDAALLHGALQRWGDAAPAHLVGDYAFAAWDTARQRLLLARDHAGVRQLYYHLDTARLAFATELKALFELGDVPRRLDEIRLADYLLDSWIDWESTLYRDVRSLPPACLLAADRRAVTAPRRYWQLDPGTPELGGTMTDHAQRFREVFTRAVADRLGPPSATASTLSGGLDSTSVTVTARRLLPRGELLRTVSGTFDEVRSADESAFLQEVAFGPGMAPRFFNPEATGFLADFEGSTWDGDEPFWPPSPVTWEAQRAAAAAGAAVMLDGHGGDDVVNHGFARVTELALAGRVLTAGRAMGALHAEFGTSYSAIAMRWVARPLQPAWLRGRRRGATLPDTLPMPLRADFIQRHGLRDRLLQARTLPPRNARQHHLDEMTSALDPVIFGSQDRAGALAGVESRYPFYDRRLMELAFALPASARMDQGFTRAVLREAMRGLLPERIRARRGKTTMGDLLIHSLRGPDAGRLSEAINDAGPLAGAVDVQALREVHQRFLRTGGYADAHTLMRAARMRGWLLRQGLGV